MTIKVGDEVCLKHSFIVIDWNIDKETVTIEVVINEDMRERFNIPIYNGLLGIYPYPINFATPGDYVNISSEDYYQVISYEENTVIHDKDIYKLKLDENFRYTGIYYLVHSKNAYRVIKKKAQRMTRDEVTYILSQLEQSKLDPELIGGRIIRMYHKHINSAEEIQYVNSIASHMLNGMINTNTIAVIHDHYTSIEFELDARFIRVK